MDLIDLKPSERIVEITSPKNDANLGVKVTLLSINDQKLKKIKRQFLDQKMRLDSRGKNFKAEDLETNSNKLIFTAMTGWTWDKGVKFKGVENIEFNEKNVNAVLDELSWFKEQLEEAISDEKAFF